MNIKGISQGETTQETDNKENKYIPGSSEKKRASVMYLFFGIFVSLSKKEFNPFELYHLKQAIGLWTLLLPIILISFIPIIKWIGVFVLAILVWILAASFVNAINWKYFDDSKNFAFTLPAGIWWWFLDLFELWIKSKNPEEDIKSVESTDSIQEKLQNENTTLEEDVQKLDGEQSSTWDANSKDWIE